MEETAKEALHILEEALKQEKLAEVNCDVMLKKFQLNGFVDMVKHIENDEVRHQEMVKKLMGFLSA